LKNITVFTHKNIS